MKPFLPVVSALQIRPGWVAYVTTSRQTSAANQECVCGRVYTEEEDRKWKRPPFLEKNQKQAARLLDSAWRCLILDAMIVVSLSGPITGAPPEVGVTVPTQRHNLLWEEHWRPKLMKSPLITVPLFQEKSPPATANASFVAWHSPTGRSRFSTDLNKNLLRAGHQKQIVTGA